MRRRGRALLRSVPFFAVAVAAPLLVGSFFGPRLSASEEGTAGEGAPAKLSADCRPTALTRRPGYTVSAAWRDNGDLLIVDNLQEQVLRFNRSGRSLGTIPEAVGKTLENFSPLVVKSRGSNVVLELANGRLVTLDRDFVPVRRRSVLAEGVRDGAKIEFIFLWDLAGEDVITFGDVKTGPNPEDWKTGFLRFPMDDPAAFQFQHEVEPRDPSNLFYRLGHPYITSLRDTGYILAMESTMGIHRSEPGVGALEPLDVFPPGSRQAPRLPAWETRDGFSTVMRAVEKSSMPTALLGWEDSLYVVWRDPAGDATRWSITRIDPQSEEVLGTAVLPTRANHLTVVPGPREWAFIEKGPVLAWGQQNVDSVYFISADRFRGPLHGNLCG